MPVHNNQITPEDVSTQKDDIDTRQLQSQEFKTATELRDWLVTYIARIADIHPDKVDINMPFDYYGLDSVAGVGLTGDLADWLGHDLDATLLYEYSTISSLTNYLAGKSANKLTRN
jgi:acyl carrier protein